MMFLQGRCVIPLPICTGMAAEHHYLSPLFQALQHSVVLASSLFLRDRLLRSWDELPDDQSI